MSSWVRLNRDIRNRGWYYDSSCLVVYIHLLTGACWSPIQVDGRLLNPGQIYTSQNKLATELYMSRGAVRNALKKLENYGEIKSETVCHRASIITLCSFETNTKNMEKNNKNPEEYNAYNLSDCCDGFIL